MNVVKSEVCKMPNGLFCIKIQTDEWIFKHKQFEGVQGTWFKGSLSKLKLVEDLDTIRILDSILINWSKSIRNPDRQLQVQIQAIVEPTPNYITDPAYSYMPQNIFNDDIPSSTSNSKSTYNADCNVDTNTYSNNSSSSYSEPTCSYSSDTSTTSDSGSSYSGD